MPIDREKQTGNRLLHDGKIKEVEKKG